MATPTDPSVLPLSTPVLEHTLNTEGNLGLFVNPYTCDCQTCKHYIGRSNRPPLTPPLQGLTTVPPDIPGPPPLRRVNAWAQRVVNPVQTQELMESDAMAKLLALRTFLKVQQRRCREVTDPEALAAADFEWSDLEHKIWAIEKTLEAFGICD